MKTFFHSRLGALLTNIFLALLLLTMARCTFIAFNYSWFEGYADAELWRNIFIGGFRFDLSALFYINGLYIILYLFPFHKKENPKFHRFAKILFVTLNAIALLTNLCDCVYVAFTGRRTTWSVFSEFANEGNLGSIMFSQMLKNLHLVALFAICVWGIWKLYRTPNFDTTNKKRYYITMPIALIVAVLCAVGSIRGGIDRTTRPITISNANQYVNRPIEATAVLNTPFSIIRSIGGTNFNIAPYMADNEALKYFTPLHQPADSTTFKPKNVVILIVESFSRSYIGALNRDLDGGKYKGFSPFLDELIAHSKTYKYSFANGTKSIDGMPSILSSIPMMIEPFFLTPAAMNHVGGIAHELGNKGYTSAFFHGAPNGSMGFEAFAKSSGWQKYYGKTEYCQSPNHNGEADYDGVWAIWDMPFLQFYAETMSEMKKPFVTAVFTASSHDPFQVPKEYATKYPEEGDHPIYKCLRYTDESLRRFFETAKKQPWYANTLFVITSDHSNVPPHKLYETDQNRFASPVIFFAPGDETLVGLDEHTVAQQIDIMPTVLGYLGYDKPYVAFGVDLFNTPKDDIFAFSYLNGIYQYTRGDYFLQFDGTKPTALFNFRADPYLTHNLLTEQGAVAEAMLPALKSFIQQYASRMREDNLLAK